MEITQKERALLLAAFVCGYERGHNDTVESCYTDSTDAAEDWVNDALEDGGLDHILLEDTPND